MAKNLECYCSSSTWIIVSDIGLVRTVVLVRYDDKSVYDGVILSEFMDKRVNRVLKTRNDFLSQRIRTIS